MEQKVAAITSKCTEYPNGKDSARIYRKHIPGIIENIQDLRKSACI